MSICSLISVFLIIWLLTNYPIIISGVLAAYKGCISRIQLYGPTNFAPTINHVARIASQFRDGSQYFILLIITDGIITDMPQTKKVNIRVRRWWSQKTG